MRLAKNHKWLKFYELENIMEKPIEEKTVKNFRTILLYITHLGSIKNFHFIRKTTHIVLRVSN